MELHKITTKLVRCLPFPNPTISNGIFVNFPQLQLTSDASRLQPHSPTSQRHQLPMYFSPLRGVRCFHHWHGSRLLEPESWKGRYLQKIHIHHFHQVEMERSWTKDNMSSSLISRELIAKMWGELKFPTILVTSKRTNFKSMTYIILSSIRVRLCPTWRCVRCMKSNDWRIPKSHVQIGRH